MTSAELESYRQEVANELLNVRNVKVLNTIKRLIKRSVIAQKSIAKVDKSERTEDPQTPSPCCYTTEEIRESIVNALDVYNKGMYFISDKSTKEILRWTENAHNDSEAILNYIKSKFSQGESWKFIALIDNVLEIITYNHMSGKKDPLFADMCDGNIRTININKHSRLIYMKRPECILILAIYCTGRLDSVRKLRK